MDFALYRPQTMDFFLYRLQTMDFPLYKPHTMDFLLYRPHTLDFLLYSAHTIDSQTHRPDSIDFLVIGGISTLPVVAGYGSTGNVFLEHVLMKFDENPSRAYTLSLWDITRFRNELIHENHENDV